MGSPGPFSCSSGSDDPRGCSSLRVTEQRRAEWFTGPCPYPYSPNYYSVNELYQVRAREFGADDTINNSSEDAVERVKEMTDGLGADVVMEAVGVPATFELCTELVRPGGRVANIGVHGQPATLHLETLWIKSITTGLVDTSSTPTLLKLVSEGRLDPTPLVPTASS